MSPPPLLSRLGALFALALTLGLLGLLGACQGPRPVQQAGARAPVPARPPQQAQPSAEVAAALSRARKAVADAKKLMPGWSEADPVLAEAQSAANNGSERRAINLAEQAAARAGFAVDGQYLTLAHLELQKAQIYTGLSDAQLGQLRAAELAIASGQGRKAYESLSALTRKLAETSQRYVVAAGDSLWVISGKPEIYGNPWLWPLIWQANLATIKNPNVLLQGQKLKIRANPTIEDVVKAVEFARTNGARDIRIGEVREE